MPCYHPIAAYQPSPGAKPLLYGPMATHGHLRPLHGRIELPCGRCTGCLRRRSLEWATRCVHEAQLHRYNCYLTLTYDDNKLPENSSLRHSDYVLFMKAIRNALGREGWDLRYDELTYIRNRAQHIIRPSGLYGAPPHTPIKFYMAGEYGEQYGRPHYHALLFGLDFGDKVYHGRTKAGEKIYKSETLARLWKNGYSSIGAVTFNSAAYISRYVMKKRFDENKDYEILDIETGEIIKKKKEYNCMSRSSGIGSKWLEQYSPDIYTTDRVITKSGRILKPPRYYDKQYKKMDAAHLEHLKHVRELEALAQKEHHTPARLAVQEAVANAQARHQKRNFN